MNLFQWLCFLSLGIAFATRDLTLRHHTKYTQPLDISSMIGPFQFTACLLMLPVALYLGLDLGADVWLQPFVIFAAIAKGFLIWINMFNYHKILKESLAAGAYILPIATGVIAVLNFAVYGAELTLPQWISIAIIAGLAWLFFLFGPLGKLSKTAMLAFASNTTIMCSFGLFDHGVTTQANWYIYLFYSSIGMLLGNLIFARKQFFKIKLSKKSWSALYFIWVIPEFLVHMVMITVLPISLVFLGLCMRMTISMPLSAILWKDGCPKRLLLFAIAGILAMVPLIFG